jgi:FAD/FMN-containing dehydrogenase
MLIVSLGELLRVLLGVRVRLGDGERVRTGATVISFEEAGTDVALLMRHDGATDQAEGTASRAR